MEEYMKMYDHPYCEILVQDQNLDESQVVEDNSQEINIDELLIDMVKNYPHLYDKKHCDFKDALKKENSWEEISKILNISVADTKTRWTRLRERFSREKKAFEDDYRSGKEGSIRTIWPLYKNLEFLKPFVVGRQTLSNLTKNVVSATKTKPVNQSSENQEQKGETEIVQQKNFEKDIENNNKENQPVQRPMKRKLPKYDSVDNSILNLTAAVSSHLSGQTVKPSTKSQETEEVFAALVADELKKLPDFEKSNKKKAILKVLFDI